MSPSPFRQKLLRILGVGSSNKAKKNSKNVPINLYTNFYFKVETKSDDNSSSSADLSVNSVESPDFEEIDFSTRRLTTENVKKVKRLHKSKSVEDWLNTIETLKMDAAVRKSQTITRVWTSPSSQGCVITTLPS